MTVVASYLYRNGKRANEVALSSQPFEITAGDFVWIGLTDPTVEEMRGHCRVNSHNFRLSFELFLANYAEPLKVSKNGMIACPYWPRAT